MAREVSTRLIDDTDGKEAHQTVRYGLDGVTYEIDLSDANAAKLRAFLGKFIPHSTRVKGTAGAKAPHRAANAPELDSRAIRAWAESQGIEVSSRGRVPAEVVAQYQKAHGARG